MLRAVSRKGSVSVDASAGGSPPPAMTSGNGVNYNTVLGTVPQSTIGNTRTATISVTLGNCGLI